MDSARRFDLVFAFITFLVPLGYSMSGLPPNIILACICWGLTFAFLAHFFCTWDKAAYFSWWSKFAIVIGLAVVIIWFIHIPITNEYKKEHAPPSFVFVQPAVVLDGNAWLMFVVQRGRVDLHNVEITFLDQDYKNALLGDFDINKYAFSMRLSELDRFPKESPDKFIWKPFSFNDEHFSIITSSAESENFEELYIKELDQKWYIAARVFDRTTGKILLWCRDKGYPSPPSWRVDLQPCFPKYNALPKPQ